VTLALSAWSLRGLTSGSTTCYLKRLLPAQRRSCRTSNAGIRNSRNCSAKAEAAQRLRWKSEIQSRLLAGAKAPLSDLFYVPEHFHQGTRSLTRSASYTIPGSHYDDRTCRTFGGSTTHDHLRMDTADPRRSGRLVTARTKVIVINSPSVQSGRCRPSKW
jgi:hypothetical protein